MLYRILVLLRKKVLLPEQVRALARLAHEQDKYEQLAHNWQKVEDIAAEAKKRMKSELDVADVLKLYCLVSLIPIQTISGIYTKIMLINHRLFAHRFDAMLCRSIKLFEMLLLALPSTWEQPC